MAKITIPSAGVSGTVNTKIKKIAVEIKDKFRVNARLGYLRSAMKKETQVMNQAYQALGRIYYENLTREEKEKEENRILCRIVEKSRERLERANIRYMEIALGEDFAREAAGNVSGAAEYEGNPAETRVQRSDSLEIAGEDSF